MAFAIGYNYFMFYKRILLIVSIVVLTAISYIFMNRNYDPLARYPYDNDYAKSLILEYMDEREIKYIIDYSIAPDEFLPYIYASDFKAYNVVYYNKASEYLYFLNNNETVEVVEKILEKNLDFDLTIKEYMFLSYEEIMQKLS